MDTTNKPKISVVMVDGSFRERFHSLDYLADQTMSREDYEVLWCEYYGHVAPELSQRLEAMPNARAICLDRGGVYHSSYCFNAGIAAARGELIVIPDADLVFERDFLETVWRDHEQNERLVEYFHRYNEPEPAEAKVVKPVTIERLRQVCKLTNPANYGACLSVRRQWLMAINGYEQHPVFATGFHANDVDVYTRLRNLGLVVRWHPEVRLYHPWHPQTAYVAPNFTPQHWVINQRGRALEPLPYQGIDPSLYRAVPPELDVTAEWLLSLELPFRERAMRKMRKGLSRLHGTLTWRAAA